MEKRVYTPRNYKTYQLETLYETKVKGIRKNKMLYPKIGIRPTIDGRWGGIRESLEEQTMGGHTSSKAGTETEA